MIRVMVVDDSPLVRRVLSDLLSRDPDISEVVTAANGSLALGKLDIVRPDVITMDLEMPGLSGLDTIRSIMLTRPTPIVVISGSAMASAERSLNAIELGAIDVIEKPGGTQSADMASVEDQLTRAVKNAAKVKAMVPPRTRVRAETRAPSTAAGLTPDKPRAGQAMVRRRFDIVAIGASTGGPTAIKEVLLGLPADFPLGIAVVQHMPASFTTAYAKRLDSVCGLKVREASPGGEFRPGTVLIAPGDTHLKIGRGTSRPLAVLDRSEKVNKHRPSVDVLMNSVSRLFGRRAIGVIMTGMGRDGARGMKELHAAGGYVLAQDEASSVIYGMNRAVVEDGSCDEIAALGDIAGRLVSLTAPLPQEGP